MNHRYTTGANPLNPHFSITRQTIIALEAGRYAATRDADCGAIRGGGEDVFQI
jgi:hypothetical protein